MDINSIRELLTLIGACVAAITGILGLFFQLRGKSDNYRVRYGSLKPDISPETSMHVISRSDHEIIITDYGFIDENRKLQSVFFENYENPYRSIRYQGSSTLAKRSSYYEVSFLRNKPAIGTFAISANQNYPRVHFCSGTPLYIRLIIRLKTIWNQSDYLK